jgi:hypothetical protein
MNRSSKPMSDDELCTRDRQQIEFAEKTKNLAILPLGALTEAQRQEVIREKPITPGVCRRAQALI